MVTGHALVHVNLLLANGHLSTMANQVMSVGHHPILVLILTLHPGRTLQIHFLVLAILDLSTVVLVEHHILLLEVQLVLVWHTQVLVRAHLIHHTVGRV